LGTGGFSGGGTVGRVSGAGKSFAHLSQTTGAAF
jgi:hypothetical protein